MPAAASYLFTVLSRQPGRACDTALALASRPPADHLDDLHPTQLPIAHAHTSVVMKMVMNGAADGLMLRGEVA